MLKRLWQILGPVFCAGLLVIIIIAYYPITEQSYKTEKIDASELTQTNFKSSFKKVRALTNPKHRFIPFFGSSEWSRMDKMHPSVLAEAYHRDYTPYLLGQKGAASLTQYFGIQQIGQELEQEQAIYVISPQWFTPEGANATAFQNYSSTGQVVDFLQNQTGTAYDRYAAQRFLELYPNNSFRYMLEKVVVGKSLSETQQYLLAIQQKIFQKEDAFFSQFSVVNHYQKKIVPQSKKLPRDFSYAKLEEIAMQEGRRQTGNNEFGIANHFYTYRISHQRKRLKGSQKAFNYIKSPEYNDLQLVLNQFAISRTNVLFVIPPVNSKWATFTGLNQDMYQQSVAKIKYQLQSQGFTNIADFSKDGDKPYFMQDTIHMGWNGWLALDKVVNPFLSQPQPTTHYKMNKNFLSQNWADYDGQPEQFK